MDYLDTYEMNLDKFWAWVPLKPFRFRVCLIIFMIIAAPLWLARLVYENFDDLRDLYRGLWHGLKTGRDELPPL